MYDNFKVVDPKTGAESDRGDNIQFVVLHKQNGSRIFRPVFHCEALDREPKLEPDPTNGTLKKSWDPTAAGAIQYIREHQTAQDPGSVYIIKNRKGEIVG